MAKGLSTREVIATFVIAVLGLSVTPSIGDATYAATHYWNGTHWLAGNVTGISATILDLFPVFWVIMILAIPIVEVYRYFKAMQQG